MRILDGERSESGSPCGRNRLDLQRIDGSTKNNSAVLSGAQPGSGGQYLSVLHFEVPDARLAGDHQIGRQTQK